MAQKKPIESEILDLVQKGAWERVAGRLAEFHPADIADIIEQTPSDARSRLFSIVPANLKPDVLSELESATSADILEDITTHEVLTIVEEMAPDDAVDILGDMSTERSEEILGLMHQTDSAEVRKLLEYDEDTAGGIMTPDVVSLSKDATVAEAVEAIAYFEDGEPFFYAYIVDQDRRLIGYVDIWELLREKQRTRRLGDLLHSDFVAAKVDMDQEYVAHLLSQYDLSAIPVVDATGVLVGRVTSDDVIDVIEEEASEDIFRLAGSDDSELDATSLFKNCLIRLPWLFITLLGGFVTSLILKRFHAHISHLLILAAFVPIVLAMGGNTGIQSSTLMVRSIALGGHKGRSVPSMLAREIGIGALMGIVCGVIIGIWVNFMGIRNGGVDLALAPHFLSVIVALALFSAMTFATMFGALVPIILDKLRVDPAVAAGPFISITNDISALLIYFGVTVLLLEHFTRTS